MNHGVIATLRDLVPIRPLTREEALRVAELQAQRFHKLLGFTEPLLPETAIAELPRVQVERMSPIPVSGSTHWASNRWLIVLNGAEPAARQRFSLCHEFKHILDHHFVDVLYQGVAEPDRQRWIEQVCDYFAGCLLMPRPWVKRLYCSGIQRVTELATHFGTSPQAMHVRLSQIGLLEPAPRCARVRPEWNLQVARGTGSPADYHRSIGLRRLAHERAGVLAGHP